MTTGTALERSLRRFEWLFVGAALFLYSGAVFPLLMEGADGILDEGERAMLRVLFLPVYPLTLVLLALRPRPLALALVRNLPMLLLLMLAVLSVTWSISQTITIRRIVALVLSTGMAYLLATRFSPRQQIVLLATVLGGACILSLLAAATLPSRAFMPDSGELRGIFLHKNVLGWVASFAALLGLAARHDALPTMRRAGWVLLGIGLTCMLLSGSATGLVSTVAAIAVVSAVHAVNQRHGPARVTVALVFIIALTLLLASLATLLLPLLDLLGKDATLTGRVPLWHLVDPEIAQRLVLGHGFGTFWSEASPDAWKVWAAIGWQAPHAHNGYRDLLLGVGAVGLALFSVATVRALLQASDLYEAAPSDGWLWCFAAIVASLVMNMTESTILMQNDLMWLLFATAVLTLSLHHAELRARAPRHVRLAQVAV